MKKTYIEPKNTVVRIKMETMIASSAGDTYTTTTEAETETSGDLKMQSREVIDIPDVWEEW